MKYVLQYHTAFSEVQKPTIIIYIDFNFLILQKGCENNEKHEYSYAANSSIPWSGAARLSTLMANTLGPGVGLGGHTMLEKAL